MATRERLEAEGVFGRAHPRGLIASLFEARAPPDVSGREVRRKPATQLSPLRKSYANTGSDTSQVGAYYAWPSSQGVSLQQTVETLARLSVWRSPNSHISCCRMHSIGLASLATPSCSKCSPDNSTSCGISTCMPIDRAASLRRHTCSLWLPASAVPSQLLEDFRLRLQAFCLPTPSHAGRTPFGHHLRGK